MIRRTRIAGWNDGVRHGKIDGRRGDMATAARAGVTPGRLLLPNIDWRTYSRLLRLFAERPAVRLAYDRGDLEIMSPLPEHESDAHLLGRVVEALTEELGIPIKAGRSTTLR